MVKHLLVLLAVSLVSFSTSVHSAVLSNPEPSVNEDDPANIISNANIKMDSQVVNFRGNPKHKALHVSFFLFF